MWQTYKFPVSCWGKAADSPFFPLRRLIKLSCRTFRTFNQVIDLLTYDLRSIHGVIISCKDLDYPTSHICYRLGELIVLHLTSWWSSWAEDQDLIGGRVWVRGCMRCTHIPLKSHKAVYECFCRGYKMLRRFNTLSLPRQMTQLSPPLGDTCPVLGHQLFSDLRVKSVKWPLIFDRGFKLRFFFFSLMVRRVFFCCFFIGSHWCVPQKFCT